MTDNTDFQRITCKKALPYYYLSVSLEFENPRREVDPILFKKSITMAMKEMFGEIGASTQVDVLRFKEETRSALLRVDSRNYVKLRGALMVYGGFLESKDPCAFRVHQVSQHLLALADSSRRM